MKLKIYSKKDSIIIGILHMFNIILLLMSIFIGVYANKYYLIFFTSVYVLVFEVVLRIQNVISLQILTIYMQLAGPLQLLLVEVSPISVFGTGSKLKRIHLIDSVGLVGQYFVLSISFYLLLVLCFGMIYFFVGRVGLTVFSNKMDETLCSKSIFSHNALLKYFVIVVYAIFEWYIRITFGLNVPGVVPTIRFAGVYVYLISFVHQYLAYMCLKDFYSKNKVTSGTLISLIFDYIIISVPDLLLDRRAPLLFLVIIAFMHIYYIKKDEFIVYFKKNKLFFVGLVIAVLFAFAKFSELVRYRGLVKLPITFFLSRITGLADGLTAIDYLNQGGLDNFVQFNIADYFHNVVINGARSSMSYYYTHTVLGYPVTAVHRDSLPLFVGSLMYSAFWGFIFMAFIFGIIFVVADLFISKNIKRGGSPLFVYIGCYLSIHAVGLLMGGGAESLIEIFTLPVMLFVYKVIVGERIV